MQADPGTVIYSELSDAELARHIVAHNPQAFELLMRRHNQSLYRTARSILRDDAEAEDAVQDAYLLAYSGMDKFRGDAKLSTWLTRIVVNEALAKSRKRTRRAEVISLGGDTEWEQQATEEIGRAHVCTPVNTAHLVCRPTIEKKKK